MSNKIMINKMIKTLILLVFVFVMPSLSLSSEKPKKISRAENYIAVLDIETVGKVEKDIKRPLTDSIRLEIVKSGKWKVIERSNMDKILKEQKFQQACTSTECIVEVGQLLGVGKMIMGSVSMVGKTYYLSLQLVNVESGQIENVSEDECKCEVDDLIKSSKRLTKKLFGETVALSETQTEQKTIIVSETKQTQEPLSTTDPTTGIGMIFVKGGCFDMGDTFGDGEPDEKPVHEVCLDDFYIGKHEVTVGQFKKFVNDTGYKTTAERGDGCYVDITTPKSYKKERDKNWRNAGFLQDDNNPVVCVSWHDAVAFADWLKNKTGKSYKLPTEAEWEYAARSGGKKEKWSGTNSELELVSYAWYDKNSGDRAHPVGQKKPNGLGIYDMSGNVWEWCADWYDKNYYQNSPKNNPTGPSSWSNKVIRGGIWTYNAFGIRNANRRSGHPNNRSIYDGFRLVMTK